MIIMIIRPLPHILKVITKIKRSSHNQCKYVVKNVDEIAMMKKLSTLTM